MKHDKPKLINIASRLETGTKLLGLRLDSRQIESLIAYLRLLEKWNRVYNLTAIRCIEQMITAHLLDSLAIHPYIKGPRVLDVGSGAGLPGIPLAVTQSTNEFVLVDSNAKKTRFLLQVSYELPLTNIRVERTRIEDYPEQAPFDTVVCRAFGRLSEFIAIAGKHCKHSGRMLALKGRFPEIELACIPTGFELGRVYKLRVPYLEQQRHVVEIMRI